MGGVLGLDYPAVFKLAEWLEIDLDNRTMGGIQMLERITIEMQAEALKDSAEKS